MELLGSENWFCHDCAIEVADSQEVCPRCNEPRNKPSPLSRLQEVQRHLPKLKEV